MYLEAQTVLQLLHKIHKVNNQLDHQTFQVIISENKKVKIQINQIHQVKLIIEQVQDIPQVPLHMLSLRYIMLTVLKHLQVMTHLVIKNMVVYMETVEPVGPVELIQQQKHITHIPDDENFAIFQESEK